MDLHRSEQLVVDESDVSLVILKTASLLLEPQHRPARLVPPVRCLHSTRQISTIVLRHCEAQQEDHDDSSWMMRKSSRLQANQATVTTQRPSKKIWFRQARLVPTVIARTTRIGLTSKISSDWSHQSGQNASQLSIELIHQQIQRAKWMELSTSADQRFSNVSIHVLQGTLGQL